MQEWDSFTLQEPLTDPTFEIGSDDDPKWREFWDLVPRKQGKDEARKAYVNHVLGTGEYDGRPIRKTDPDVIIAGMRSYADRVKRDRTERKHIKMAQGWINGRRWEDETANSRQDEGPVIDIWALSIRSVRSSSRNSRWSRRSAPGSPPAARHTRTGPHPCRWATGRNSPSC
jgi:hypothetical protein